VAKDFMHILLWRQISTAGPRPSNDNFHPYKNN